MRGKDTIINQGRTSARIEFSRSMKSAATDGEPKMIGAKRPPPTIAEDHASRRRGQRSGNSLKYTSALVKGLMWPLIVLFCGIYWVSPLTAILNAIPPLLSKADTINVGSLQLKINSVALPTPSDEVAEALRNLSPREIQAILQDPPTTYHCIGSNTDSYLELAYLTELNLYEKNNGKKEICNGSYYYHMNEGGAEIRDYLIKLIIAQVKK